MTMTRVDLLRHCFTKDSRLIEVGASYNPIVPKSEGWKTTIIDHADQATLRVKYQAETPERIEPVDHVWTGQPIDKLLESQLGSYDGLIASHVGEHLPDLIGFLNSLDKVLNSSGVIVLALPDKRLCFDFFRPVTTTGMLLQANAERHTRHGLGQIFDSHAYFSMRNGAGAWMRDVAANEGGTPALHTTLGNAFNAYREAATDSEYHDAHGWCFTPTSFQLNILELHACDVIPWHIARIERAAGVEFYVWLERRTIKLGEAELNAERHRLLLLMMREDADDTKLQLSAARVAVPSLTPTIATTAIPKNGEQPTLTITAIVPLYNGGRFIANALRSIADQTLPALEVIVVDDGSSDNGAEVVKDFQAQNPNANVILLQKSNGGQSSARNYGVRHARGDLIAMLDQDDQWYAKHLETLIEPFYEQPPGQPLGWVYSDLDEADVFGRIIHHNFLSTVQKQSMHPKRDVYACIDRDMFILPSASLISRAVFNEVGGFDERLSGYEDDDLFMRIFRAGKNNIFLETALSKWCIHEGSSSYRPSMRRSRMIYCRKLLEMFPDRPDKKIWMSRDTILPRFYRHAQAEWRAALVSGNLDQIEETLIDLRFLINAAVAGDGIHQVLPKPRAVMFQRVFNNLTAAQAYRNYRRLLALRPIVVRTVPQKIWRRIAATRAIYG